MVAVLIAAPKPSSVTAILRSSGEKAPEGSDQAADKLNCALKGGETAEGTATPAQGVSEAELSVPEPSSGAPAAVDQASAPLIASSEASLEAKPVHSPVEREDKSCPAEIVASSRGSSEQAAASGLGPSQQEGTGDINAPSLSEWAAVATTAQQSISRIAALCDTKPQEDECRPAKGEGGDNGGSEDEAEQNHPSLSGWASVLKPPS